MPNERATILVRTCQAKMVVGSSFTPSVDLLACSNGTVYPIVNCHKFTQGHKHDASKTISSSVIIVEECCCHVKQKSEF